MNLSIRSMLITALMVVVISGCSGHGAPSAPNITDETGTGQELTDIARDGAVSQGDHYLLMYNLINIDASDPDDVKMEVIPIRLGEIHLNILKLLEVAPCTNCFKIVGFNVPEPGVLDVDIEITHPFDNLDFSVFDVRGIMMFDGSHLFPVSGKSISDQALGDGALLNADGYTALYNGSTFGQAGDLMTYFPGKISTPTIPDADINGYICHYTESTRNAFFAGDSVIQTYTLKMPTTTFVLGYAVDANWWTPIETPVDDPITDFDLDANCPEPWKIEYDENPIDQGLHDQGGSTVLTIDVYDHESKDTHTAPILECTEIFDGSVTAVFLEDGVGYSRWYVTISNDLLAPEGDYLCLVSVEANENAASPDYLELIAYQLLPLHVAKYLTEGCIAKAAFEPDPQTVCLPINFFDDGSIDLDEVGFTKYEWDWDNDGVYDESGVSVHHVWYVPGIFEVNFKVTNANSAWDELDVLLEVTIENAMPTAAAEASKTTAKVDEEITFDATSSYDNDCDNQSIILSEWDWNNDGIYDETGDVVTHSWDAEGTYEVQLRVTDDEGDTDEMDSPLEIVIYVPCPDPIEEIEPNNLSGEATELPINCEGLGWVDPAVDPIDWWRLDIQSDGVLEVTVETVSSDSPSEDGIVWLCYWDGGVYLQLIDADSVSGTTGSNKVLSLRGGVGTYYLLVNSSSFVDNWSYMVTATHKDGDPADFYTEPNDTYEEAADLPLNVPRTGWVNVYADVFMEDYWRIDVASDGVLEVTIETISSDSTNEFGGLYLYYWNGEYLENHDLAVCSGAAGSDTMASIRCGAGTYYLQCITVGIDNWYYTVTATHTEGDPADFYTEPNEEYWQAASLPLNIPTTGWVNEFGGATRKDWWQIDVESEGLLEVTMETISSDHWNNQSAEVRLFYWDGALVSKDYADVYGLVGSSEVLSCDAVVGTYYVRCDASEVDNWYYQSTATVE